MSPKDCPEMISTTLRSVIALALVASLAGCGGGKNKAQFASDLAAAKTTQIGVNAYLWKAALDTLSFMPLLQSDSNGGVIVTDWYVNPNQPAERMKMTVTIFDADLRADAVRVSPQRQVLNNGNWVDQPVLAATAQKLEDIILTKARDLRRTTIAG
jgi:hypothetical protein